MKTLEEIAAQADCFIWGHQWKRVQGGIQCQNCGEVRR